jgi:Na+-driven multidrug efflux pump
MAARSGLGPQQTRFSSSFRALKESVWARCSGEREVIELAWPIAVAMLGETAIGLVDTFLLDAGSIVLRASLRAAKDVRVVAVVGILVAWTCIPGCAWVFGKQLGMGALGGWLGFVAETALGAVVFWLRWKRGGWRARFSGTH